MWLRVTLRWVRGHVLALGVLLAVLSLYTLGGFLLVPHLVRTALVDYAHNVYTAA